jgi:hypothetical protein
LPHRDEKCTSECPTHRASQAPGSDWAHAASPDSAGDPSGGNTRKWNCLRLPLNRASVRWRLSLHHHHRAVLPRQTVKAYQRKVRRRAKPARWPVSQSSIFNAALSVPQRRVETRRIALHVRQSTAGAVARNGLTRAPRRRGGVHLRLRELESAQGARGERPSRCRLLQAHALVGAARCRLSRRALRQLRWGDASRAHPRQAGEVGQDGHHRAAGPAQLRCTPCATRRRRQRPWRHDWKRLLLRLLPYMRLWPWVEEANLQMVRPSWNPPRVD